MYIQYYDSMLMILKGIICSKKLPYSTGRSKGAAWNQAKVYRKTTRLPWL